MRAELAGLGRELAAETGAHLAACSFFFESDPDRAWAHAIAARRRAARLGVVRETAGLAAYRAGQYAEALSELRTARRITGSNIHLPVMADSERGLERPERALELAHSPEARTLDRNSAIELLIVESGARNDLGEHDAAVVVLQIPELESKANSPTLARLRFAYSEALNRAAREREAEAWRERAMDSDRDGTADLYAAPDEDDIIDLLEDDDEADSVDGEDDEHEDTGEDDADEGDSEDDTDDTDDTNADQVEDVDDVPSANQDEKRGDAQFTDIGDTRQVSAPPSGPAPLPKFESEAKGDA